MTKCNFLCYSWSVASSAKWHPRKYLDAVKRLDTISQNLSQSWRDTHGEPKSDGESGPYNLETEARSFQTKKLPELSPAAEQTLWGWFTDHPQFYLLHLYPWSPSQCLSYIGRSLVCLTLTWSVIRDSYLVGKGRSNVDIKDTKNLKQKSSSLRWKHCKEIWWIWQSVDIRRCINAIIILLTHLLVAMPRKRRRWSVKQGGFLCQGMKQ